MPRKARLDAPGALQHIIVSGREGSPIFKGSRDYENFLTRLGSILTETSTTCYAWALLANHIHLLLRTGTTPITTVMRRLLTGYARQFNRRHNRHGYLFQNRYKSFLCEDDPYLLELLRYIHLNPIRARKAKDMEALDTYPKTGHAVLMGTAIREWQDTNCILTLFNQKTFLARRAYRSFVAEGIALGKRPDLTGGGLIRSAGGWTAVREIRNEGLRVASDERVLGSSDFVRSVLRKANKAYNKRMQAKGLTLDSLITFVADQCGADETLIKSAVKQRIASQTRAIVVYLAIHRLRISGAELSRELNLTPSAVSRLAGRGRTDPMAETIDNALWTPKRSGEG